jgi:hypothetical protein
LTPRGWTVAVILLGFSFFAQAGRFLEAYQAFQSKPPQDGISAFEQRIHPILPQLKEARTIGYFSNVPNDDPNGLAQFYLTQYALVPTLLQNPGGPGLVLGLFTEPPKPTDLAAKKLIILKRVDDQIYLLRRSQ